MHWSLLSLGLFFLCMVEPVYAGEAGGWRHTYDLVMRWINFGILMFIIFKFAGPHLMNFLQSQKTDIEARIERIQKEKDEIIGKVNAAKDSLAASKVRFDDIKSRIIEDGEHKKQEMVREAEEQSRFIMQSALHRIDYLIHRAQEKLRIELLDMSIQRAMERLPFEITPEDNQKLVEKFLKSLAVSIK